MKRARHRGRLLPLAAATAVALASLLAGVATAAAPTAADRELLVAADMQRAAPSAFRAEVRVEPLAGPGAAAFELWRQGDQYLLRLLEPKSQRGKAFLQLPDATWFLSAHARPVRLDPGHKLAAGVSLHEILGVGASRDYAIEGVTRQPAGTTEMVTYDLRATAAGLSYPRVSYVVRADTRRPVRIEQRLASGKLARVLEIAAWRPGAALLPAELVIKDLVTSRSPVRLRFVTLDERQPPAHLFEIAPAGDQARAALPTPP